MRNAKLAMSVITVACALAWQPAVAEDEWDVGSNTDGSTATENLLVHGSQQRHDLQAAIAGLIADLDWYRINTKANRSYEVRLFDVTSDVNMEASRFQRVANDGTTIRQSGGQLVSGIGFNFALRWTQLTDELEFIKVTGLPSNTSSARYSISFRETTLYCPRFNNSGTQTSVLILMGSNPDVSGVCSYRAVFVDEGSTVLTSVSGSVDSNDVDVVSLSGISALVGKKGGAFVAHNCGYGGVKAKLVALEPATGFSFDTVCTPREY